MTVLACASIFAGFRGIETMLDAFASFCVTACLVLVMFWPLALVGVSATLFPKAGFAASVLMIALVFFGSGIACFTAACFRPTPGMHFVPLYRQYYSPLSLLIGTGFFICACTVFQL